jgi:Cu/Ag efflux protein CusF
LAVLGGAVPAILSSAEAGAQAPNINKMPAMGNAAQGTVASGTGTITAVNVAGRKVTLDHGPIAAIKWPAMKMEFPAAASVDLSKVKVGDKVRFTLNGSGSSYTVQAISPEP